MNHEAPIFVKVKFNVTGEKDRGHLKYIGSRPGVEKAPLSPEAAHLEYAGTRPRSTGLFGPDPDQPPTLAEAQRAIDQRERSLSWRLIISLKETDAQAAGFVGRKAWEDLTNRSMRHFCNSLGISPSDLRWVAAHHPEQGHPHVHVMAYLKNGAPQRRGQLNGQELREFRQGIADVCFGPIRAKAARERTLARDTLIHGAKTAIHDLDRQERKIALAMQIDDPLGERLPPRLSTVTLAEFGDKLQALADHMPGQGRAALKFMPPEVKTEVRQLADWLIGQPEMQDAVGKYRAATAELTRLYTSSSTRNTETLAKADNDLRDRVSNVLIKAAGEINRADRSKEIDRKMATTRTFQAAFRGIEKERLRAEAEAELASIEAAERSEQKARRELGYERY